eukprot:8662868-Pyramimonas_sp.AAC.2
MHLSSEMHDGIDLLRAQEVVHKIWTRDVSLHKLLSEFVREFLTVHCFRQQFSCVTLKLLHPFNASKFFKLEQ